MPVYVRRHVPGGTYFFTLVTSRRARWLCDDPARALLHECLEEVRAARPFNIEAIVLLPDHLHTIWTLPRGDADFSTRWAAVKGLFTRRWTARGGVEHAVTRDQFRQRRRGVWQPRFMEHAIRDGEDLIRHVEYVHHNPVRHGLAACPKDWPWSSFHRYVREGVYDSGWCCGEAGGEVGKGVDADLLE